MGGKQYEMNFALGAKIQGSYNKNFKNAQDKINSLSKTASNANKVLKNVGKTFFGVAAGLIGLNALKDATQSATEFQDQMTNIGTLMDGDVAPRLARMSKAIKQTAVATNTSTALLTDGAYQVVSAFGESGDAMKILETAAKGAKAGNATVTDSVNLLSAVTKGYGNTSAEAVKKASDLAFLTAKLGQTTFPELAASMGKVIPLASTMKIKQEELFGAMATLTGVTGNTAEVSTQLRAAVQGFLQPTDNMSKAIKKLGYSNGQAMLGALGFQGTLEALKKSVNGNEIAFSDLFGSVEAKNAVLAMTGAQAQNLTDKTNAMFSAAGATNEAFNKKANNFRGVLDKISQVLNVVKITLGEIIMKPLASIGNKIIPVIEKIPATFEKIQPKISNLTNKGKEVFNILANKIKLLSPTVENLKGIFNIVAQAVTKCFSGENSNVLQRFSTGVTVITNLLNSVSKVALDISNVISSHWGIIEPAIWGIVGAIVAWKAITTGLTVYNTVMNVIKATTLAAKLAQLGLNAAVLTNPMTWVIVGIVAAIGVLIFAIVAITKNWDKIKPVVQKVFKAVSNAVKEAVAVIKSVFGSIVGFFSSIWNKMKRIVTAFSNGVKMIVLGIVKAIITYFTKLISFYRFIWDKIKSIFSIVSTWFKAVFSAAVTAIKSVFGTVANFFSNVWHRITSVFSNTVSWFSNIFSNAVNAIKTAFSSIGDFFKGIFDGVWSTIKGFINMMINGLNSVIGGMNGLKFDIPEWVPDVGGKSFGFSIPKIPMLAQGGIVSKPTLAMIGEGREREAVMPLSKLSNFVQNKGYGSNKVSVNISVNINGNASKEDVREGISQALSQVQFDKMFDTKVQRDKRNQFGKPRYA